MSNEKISGLLGISIPEWEEAVRDFMLIREGNV